MEQVPGQKKHLRTAICALCKNEREYIVEWVAYHKVLGFDDIYIYDNVSDDGTSELLIILEQAGIIKRVFWPNSEMIPLPTQWPYMYTQYGAYSHFLMTSSQQYDFVLTIDIDEFLVFPEHTLQSFLGEAQARYPNVGSIAIPWLLFGPNGYKNKQDGLVIERFTTCAPLPANLDKPKDAVKSFYSPKRTFAVGTHRATLLSGDILNNDFEKASFSKTTPYQFAQWAYGYATIHHYFTKSEEEHFEKGRLSINTTIPQRQKNVLENFNKCSLVNIHALENLESVKKQIAEINSAIKLQVDALDLSATIELEKIQETWLTFSVHSSALHKDAAKLRQLLIRVLVNDKYEIITSPQAMLTQDQLGCRINLAHIDYLNIEKIFISIPGIERTWNFDKESMLLRGVQLIRHPAISEKIENLIRSGRYEKQEIDFVLSTLQETDRVLEIGASIGAMSTVVLSKKNVQHYTCIEANPALIEIIKTNHANNGITSSDVVNTVLTNELNSEEMDFYVAKDVWASTLSKPTDFSNFSHVEKVKTSNFFELLEKLKPTYIICDIEGGEYGLFKDPVNLTSVRIICLEIHACEMLKKQQLFDYFYREGFIPSTYFDLKCSQGVVLLRRILDVTSDLHTARDQKLSQYINQATSVLDLRKGKEQKIPYDCVVLEYDGFMSTDEGATSSKWDRFMQIVANASPGSHICIQQADFDGNNLELLTDALTCSLAIQASLDIVYCHRLAHLVAFAIFQKPSQERSRNIAMGKVVTQSSISPKYSVNENEAMRLVSGVRLGAHVMHTANEERPWIKIDLGQNSDIARILVFNRPECSERSDTLEIYTSFDDATYRTCYSHLGKKTFGGQYDGNPLEICLQEPIVARFVKLQLAGKGILHLDQVEIYS